MIQVATNVRLYWRFLRFLCRWATVLYLKDSCRGVRYVPRTGAVILVCNHQSFLDPVLATMALPREACYMARDSLFRRRLFKRLIESLNAFPIRRSAADLTAVKGALRRLKQGMALVMFPEGTRTLDGRVGPMLPGLGTIARKAAVPIVPTLIDGAFQAWPRGRALPRPASVIVEYGPPIRPAEFADLTAEELVALLRNRLEIMQHRWHTRLPHRRLEWYLPDEPRA